MEVAVEMVVAVDTAVTAEMVVKAARVTVPTVSLADEPAKAAMGPVAEMVATVGMAEMVRRVDAAVMLGMALEAASVGISTC